MSTRYSASSRISARSPWSSADGNRSTLPMRILGSGVVQNWAVRVAGDTASYGSDIRTAIKMFDSHLLITEMQPVETLVDQTQAGTRFSLLLIGVFAVIAGLLPGVGLYGVLSTVVRQRTAEIGIRMALGAGPCRIFSLVVG
jgi:hypothetical protein